MDWMDRVQFPTEALRLSLNPSKSNISEVFLFNGSGQLFLQQVEWLNSSDLEIMFGF
jgi:hypothetical protein